MIRLAERSDDERRPFANLLPLVELFLGLGNPMVGGGFVLDPDGWRCRLANPLDLGAVRDRFEVPGTMELSAQHDTILDRLSWCSIEGPGAHRSGPMHRGSR